MLGLTFCGKLGWMWKSMNPQLWQDALQSLSKEFSPLHYESYIKSLSFVDSQLDKGKAVITLSCPSMFHQVEIKRRAAETITSILSTQLQLPVTLELIVASSKKPKSKPKPSASSLFSQSVVNQQEVFASKCKAFGLEVDRTFESFAVSKTNEMAFAAAKAVASRPGSAYNPLYLYGGVGVGKTHLMHAVGQVILSGNLQAKILYCTGEDFTNSIVEAIRQHSTAAFRKQYRSLELLLIDDIQFIAGKTAVQEEFFHTFNSITKAGGQIIMTSDKPPTDIDNLEDRLKSRFSGGLTIDIGNPDFELRCAIIQIKSEQMRLDIASEVTSYLAEVVTDTRALLGSLTKIATTATTKHLPITLDLAKEVVAATKINTTPAQLSPLDVINKVCAYYHTNPRDVVGPRRQKNLTLPRHVAMYLLQLELRLGLVEIGGYFGNRDHTTVMHGVEKISTLIQTDPRLFSQIETLRQGLYR